MEQLKHFSHEHPLVLVADHAEADDVMCVGCNKSIVTEPSVYCCRTRSSSSSSSNKGVCGNFYLHKTCAELPQTMDHPMHLKHPLTLYSSPYEGETCICDVCSDEDWKWYTYQCKHCEFDVCLKCALEEQMFQQHSIEDRSFHHEGHKQHALTLLQRPTMVECDACMTEAKDLSYVCNTCPFLMHKSCAFLPSSMESIFHDHPLVLAYSLPDQYRTFRQFCNVCTYVVHPSGWLYYCANCRFFAHLKCATPSTHQMVELPLKLRSTENENDEAYERDHLDEPNLVNFPLPIESSRDSMVQQLVKAISLTDDTSIAPDHINHWAHKDHPLVLLDQHKRNNTTDDHIFCDGCVRPFSSDPYYGCVECKFYLHRACAELPSELNYPSHNCHKSGKLVCGKYTKPNFNIKCGKCSYICNGMFYSCKHCEFKLDILCASLPNMVKHKAHKHPLSQLNISNSVCKGCGKSFNGTSFGCEVCNFHLGILCTFAPSHVRHRWDRHPIPLVYPPIKDHPDVFYCEICEEEINPNYWFYFCRACDQSFHSLCLYPYCGNSNIKFGATMKADNHPHNLTFVGMKKHKFYSICVNCGYDIEDCEPILECRPCKFQLCTNCNSDNHATCLVEASKRNDKDEGIKPKIVLFMILCFIVSFIFVLWVFYRISIHLWDDLYSSLGHLFFMSFGEVCVLFTLSLFHFWDDLYSIADFLYR